MFLGLYSKYVVAKATVSELNEVMGLCIKSFVVQQVTVLLTNQQTAVVLSPLYPENMA